MPEEEQGRGLTQEQQSTPRPDPTERTKQELLREIKHLRELLESKLDGHARFANERHSSNHALLEQRIKDVERLFDLHLSEARHQLQDQIDATQLALEAALEAATKAVDKAEVAVEKRFEGVNEFRAQLADQGQTFLRRDLFDQHVRESREAAQTLQGRVDANAAQLLAISASETGGRDREAQARANIASVLALIATLVAVATLVLGLVS